MEYYEYNSNQKKMQDEHNQIELYKLKSFLDVGIKDPYKTSTLKIEFYINNINFYFMATALNTYYHIDYVLDDYLRQEIKDNMVYLKQEDTIIYQFNYYSKILNKNIERKIGHKQDKNRINNIRMREEIINFFLDSFIEEEISIIIDEFINILADNEIFINIYFSRKNEYKAEQIKTLSEKRKMKSMLENF